MYKPKDGELVQVAINNKQRLAIYSECNKCVQVYERSIGNPCYLTDDPVLTILGPDLSGGAECEVKHNNEWVPARFQGYVYVIGGPCWGADVYCSELGGKFVTEHIRRPQPKELTTEEKVERMWEKFKGGKK